MNHETYIKAAKKLATFSDVKNHRHGCVIVKDGKIISKGYNWHHRGDSTIHAEMDAIAKLKKSVDCKKCDMYVVRIGTDHMNCPLKYSKPCPLCSDMISRCGGFRRIFFSS